MTCFRWWSGVEQGKSAVQYMEGWNQYIGLRSLVAAPAELRNEKAIPRKSRRSMGRMSCLCSYRRPSRPSPMPASGEETFSLQPGLGCIIGSTMGSAKSLSETFEAMLAGKGSCRG